MIQFDKVSKIYSKNKRNIYSLKQIELKINKGEFLVVSGPSGSGKTTLLLTIGAMLKPTEGILNIDNDNIYSLSERKLNEFRSARIGFIFQMFHLIPYLNVIDNILLPPGKYNLKKANNLISTLNLEERKFFKPGELSAGEKQRLATARSLINDPDIILADEPTGNLDPENTAVIIKHLVDFNKMGKTIVLVTHGQESKHHADRIVNLKKGEILTIENITGKAQ